MKAKQAPFIRERAVQLSIVYLTRRPDLLVSASPNMDNFDILARITNSDVAFGIRVEGRLSSAPTTTSVRNLGSHSKGSLLKIGVPIYQFLFLVDTDEGFYKLAEVPGGVEQIAEASGEVKQQEWEKLDNAAIEDIIAQVSRWHNLLPQAS